MSLKPFEIEHSALDSGVLVLKLTGNMTMGDQLKTFEGTVEQYAKSNQNRVIVDMSRISYIDSSALGVLVACHSHLKKASGQLRLTGLTERVAKIVKIGGVESILHIDPTFEAAVAGISA